VTAIDRDQSRIRRRYDSPLRQQRVTQTRGRIVDAGVEIVRGLATWDWNVVTFRAVAERAGVGERTVYRHFPTERDLRDAVMGRLAEEAGVDYDSVTLASVAEVAGRVFRSLGSFAVAATPPPPADPTFIAVDDQRRRALLRAVAAEAPDLSERQHVAVAAALDILWSVASYERLVTAWGMDPDEAINVIGAAIGAVAEGIEVEPRGSRRRRSTS
jgi:AcrR family transcriptional regulator